ncbi:MAG: cytochrome b/b6 domain-containing protein [Acetobacteraceae bacterium]|nr:cytochrome b/b6 domain-containing protein [Acetobacteraceae bacterium]
MHDSILTEPAATQGLRHDPTTILLHWLTAALVVVLWTIGQTVDFAPSGALRVDYRSVHIVLGATLAVVLVARIAWRLTRNGMLPALDTGLLLLVARATHFALYVLLVAAVGLGLANAWIRGDSLFNLFTIPSIAPGDKVLRGNVEDWHALAANAVLIVAGVHAAAALFHHLFLRDATLRRMLPWRQV